MGSKPNSPKSMKAVVELNLKARAKNLSRNLNRERQLYIFSRFLARADAFFGDRIVLKGGLALELRLGNARTTKDIDLSLSAPCKDLLENLQRIGAMDLGDFLNFEVREHKHATIKNEGLLYEGFRFRVECKLAGKVYGGIFTIDLVLEKADALVEKIKNLNFLEFMEPTMISVILSEHILPKNCMRTQYHPKRKTRE